MVNAGGRGGGPDRQPPCLGNKEISADQGDQPDDDEKNEAHLPRPPESNSPRSSLPQLVQTVELRERKLQTFASLSQVFASASGFLHVFFFSPRLPSEYTPELFPNEFAAYYFADM